ncbi:MAG: hypothetical protein HZT40_12625 [Candidatus Thiothrix singaporensis]|uniref:Uncharacterized protein n=1 Tax=Candidatus Thiothrix singaporensis TaxID=2799669 RepID=A0A7L6AT48_9GAMM|nr:MAG: hypothetical protein HZT40_12625 [Candidatus Thiothrix singaporensis]
MPGSAWQWLDGLGEKFVQAPWTHAGMFIGCNLGGCWRRLFAHSSSRQLLLGILALSNVGMLLGMWSSHYLFSPADGIAWQLLQMPIQMSVIMALAMIVVREGHCTCLVMVGGLIVLAYLSLLVVSAVFTYCVISGRH